jgi:ABC-2 type transport system permease protein
MRNIWTIAKREYDHYFINPTAYVVAFMILFTIGVVFISQFGQWIQFAFQSPGAAPTIDIITSPFGFLFVLTIPALTMRLLSDEARMGTLELLLTAPVRDFELVAGKWLGSFLFVLTIIAATLVYAVILNSYVDPGIDRKLALSSYLGIILFAGALLALGVGISAVFTNQIASLFASLSLFITLFWLVGFFGNAFPNSELFGYLDMGSHYRAFNSGNIELTNVIYYISLIALGLFTGTTVIESRRWR